MGKKSNAQIKRMQTRAAARGEEYIPPPSEENDKTETECKRTAAIKLLKDLNRVENDANLKAKDRRAAKRKAEALAEEAAGCNVEILLKWYEENKKDDKQKAPAAVDKELQRKLNAAKKLQKELDRIASDEEMKAKDRRSSKRRAEAIASEEAGCEAGELLEWVEQYAGSNPMKEPEGNNDEKAGKHRSNPYIVFIGQLSYTTTKEQLFEHIKKDLGKEHTVNEETVRIRLLTDAKTKKSRGMAFVETSDPELLYAFLKLHHTHLDGRRINVERSAGGKSDSDARKSKLAEYRKEQKEFIGQTVDKMLEDSRSNGDLEKDELDDGVIALCKRHSATVVEHALKEYIEARDRHLENPSAYLTFIIGRIATEGIESSSKVSRGGAKFGREGGDRGKKRRPQSDKQGTVTGGLENKLRKMSEFSKRGVDMSISDPKAGSGLSDIFPSISRRGRGRGYM